MSQKQSKQLLHACCQPGSSSRPDGDARPPNSSSKHTHTKVTITSQQVSAVDITKEFTAAASGEAFQKACHLSADPLKALHTGQLVKDEFFTLFESVGALEV
jgi:Mak10 subunit, NatC N(alpha)-terminal acetyltransferase